MAAHPLADLAWLVNSLIAEEPVRQRFLGQCFEYLRLRMEQPGRPTPLPFDTDEDGDIRDEDKPPLLPCERYAILGALHEAVCHQESPIDPAPWPGHLTVMDLVALRPASESPLYRNSSAWAGIVSRAKDLNTVHRPNVVACLEFVRRDLAL